MPTRKSILLKCKKVISETEFVNTKIKIVPGANGGYGLYIPTRETLRQLLKLGWSHFDKDGNGFLTLTEYMTIEPVYAEPPTNGTNGGSCNNGCTTTCILSKCSMLLQIVFWDRAQTLESHFSPHLKSRSAERDFV